MTIQTRNGTWYSPLYSPAIGPSLRAAISGYDVDVILDGEMIAWDAEENKPVPFGSNRTVAEMNRNRRKRDGTLDRRDLGLHKNETDINVSIISCLWSHLLQSFLMLGRYSNLYLLCSWTLR